MKPALPSRAPRRLITAVALAGAGLLAACDPHTITLQFSPSVGDEYQFQSTIRTEFTRVLEGAPTDVVEDESVLDATESVTAVGDEISVDVVIVRDGAPARSYTARFNRGDHLTAIDLIEGAPADAVGLDLATDLPADLGSPPSTPLEPGDRWTIERRIDTGDGTIVVTGRGRVRSLGVVDGRDVAVIEVMLEVPIRSELSTPNGPVRLDGTQVSESVTTYDLADGAVRSDRTQISGSVDVVVEPPPGIEARPVPGTITYSVSTDTERVATRT